MKKMILMAALIFSGSVWAQTPIPGTIAAACYERHGSLKSSEFTQCALTGYRRQAEQEHNEKLLALQEKILAAEVERTRLEVEMIMGRVRRAEAREDLRTAAQLLRPIHTNTVTCERISSNTTQCYR